MGTPLGGGGRALACDIRIAESHAYLPYLRLGLDYCLVPVVRSAYFNLLARVEPYAVLCGERVLLKTLTLGLVEEVVEQGASLSAAIDLAKRAADQSPASIAACKGLFIRLGTYRLAPGWWQSAMSSLPCSQPKIKGKA